MRKYIAGIAIISIVAAFLACGCGPTIPTDPVEKANVEEDIYLATLLDREYLTQRFDDNYLSIKGADPDDEFLARLASGGSKARKGSECPDVFDPSDPRFLYTLSPVTWYSGRHVKIEITRTLPTFAESVIREFTLEKKWGKWVVVRREYVMPK